MAVNKIVYNGKTYTGDLNIMSGNLFQENSLANDELTVDTMSATIDGSLDVGTLFVPKGSSGLISADNKLFYVLPYIRILVDDLSRYVYGDTVLYYRDNTLMGKFYMSSSKRVGKYSFEIYCVSAVGLLDNEKHYGGIYTGVLMKDLLADIMGGIVPYTLDAIFENIPVFGWLPVSTRRENLHQLLFAEGATIKKDENGDIVFTYLRSGAATEIADDRMFIGGSIDYSTPVDTIKVLEHSYIAYDVQEPISLYEDYVPDNTITTPNGNIVSGVLVLFDKPVFDLTVDGGTVLEQGANYAVLQSGGYCKLFGKPYAHTTRENVAKKPVTRGLVSIVDNTATIDNATLVTLVNGENVAKRALAYYGYAKTINADIVVNSEKPGDIVSFNDPFGEAQNGFIQSMNSNMGGLYRASTKLVSGFIPTNPGNFYNNSITLSGSGSFVVPDNVFRVKAALIGGGHGGESGEAGGSSSNGEPGSSSVESSYYINTYNTIYYGKGGASGKPGNGGSAGKVLEVEIDVVPGQVISYQSGSGGLGGIWDTEKKSGSSGGDTTFGGKSSADGSVYQYGYVDLFSGSIYAKSGGAGIAGGSGSGVDPNDRAKRMAGSIVTGPNGEIYTPGQNAAERRATNTYGLISECYALSLGGSGGGAAVGYNGMSGNEGSATTTKATFDGNSEPGLSMGANGGHGGSGRRPIKQSPQSVIGSGGHGGHGGGGAGGEGAAETYTRIYKTSTTPVKRNLSHAPKRNGGNGGEGGDGAPGGIIVYY